MRLRSIFFCLAVLTASIAMLHPSMTQNADMDTPLNPAPGSWPTYHGDYTGQRHSKLAQITPENVDQLGLAWTFPLPARGPDQGHSHSCERHFVRDDAR